MVSMNSRSIVKSLPAWFFIHLFQNLDDSVCGMTLQEFLFFFTGASQIPLRVRNKAKFEICGSEAATGLYMLL